MNRRDFSKHSLTLLGAFLDSRRHAHAGNVQSNDPSKPAKDTSNDTTGRLFPIDVTGETWRTFRATGFKNPACGVVYKRRNRPECGMPLGSIDTGRLDLQANATFGFCTIYNSVCPQRGPLTMPFLGMTVADQKWLFCDPPGTYGEYMFAGLNMPSDIHYWGHFPVADLEFETKGSPVSVGLRAWAPFLPGDSASSNTPVAVFDVHLRNTTNHRQQGRLVLCFPGPTQEEAQTFVDCPRKKVPFKPFGHTWVPDPSGKTRAKRTTTRGSFSGVVVSSEKVEGLGYALGVVGDTEVHSGGALSYPDDPYRARQSWGKIATELPEANEHDFGGSVAVDFELQPDEQKVVSFIAAWYAPMWIGEADHTFMHMYASRYPNSLAAARFASEGHDALLKRVLAWQDVVYGEEELPVWLREALVNILYLFPVNSFWAAARPPVGPWCNPKDGLFGLLDGIVEDPAIEPIPDTFYANAPLVYFFPDLALSTLRGYKAYQFASGAAVWIWGGVVGAAVGGYEMTAGTEFAMPTPGYQTTTNGPCYVDMIDRYLLRSGDVNVLHEFYDAVKKNTQYTMSLRPEDGPEGIVSVPSGNVDPENKENPPGYHLEWFESVLWFGMTPHVGGIHLANIKMAQRLAEKVGDKEFGRQCETWFRTGSAALESKLWTGDYYLAYFDERAGKKSDDVFAYQLDGEWMARFHGIDGVFRHDRVQKTLRTIRKACIEDWNFGAVNLARPNGQLAQGVGYGPNALFVPELYMLAMTYMYAGEKDFGIELARRCVYSLNVLNLLTWNQPNLLRADNGNQLFGSHYVQNMMLWALPAAMKGQDIGTFCASGGFVDRIMQAAKTV